MNITHERAREILEVYKNGKRDLFNWCQEYKDFVNDCVLYCVSYEWDYILKKSYEDGEAPLSYEDLDLFDVDRAREHLLYDFDGSEEKYKEYANNPDTFNRRVKNKGDFEVFLNSLDKDELKQMFEDLDKDLSQAEGEVYEWWLISDPLLYRLEKQEEIFLNGAWGRQTTGQSISLDGSVMKAFIDIIKEMVLTK